MESPYKTPARFAAAVLRATNNLPAEDGNYELHIEFDEIIEDYLFQWRRLDVPVCDAPEPPPAETRRDDAVDARRYTLGPDFDEPLNKVPSCSGTFRKTYRKLTATEQTEVEDVKYYAERIEGVISKYKGREFSLAMTKLEEAVMWAVKGITG